MKGYIDKLEAMQQLPSPVPDEDIIEVKEKKKKRSNKR
jgi:hypothetical protein